MLCLQCPELNDIHIANNTPSVVALFYRNDSIISTGESIVIIYCNKCFNIVTNGETSSWCNVLSGVPQDSVLGPLFNIYVNDIPIAVNSSVLQFADDLKMFKSHKRCSRITEWH